MLRDTTTVPAAGPGATHPQRHRLLAGSAVALLATAIGTLTVASATPDRGPTPARGTTPAAITVTFVASDDPSSCTVVGAFTGLEPAELAVGYAALASGVVFEHPEAGREVTIGPDGTAVATFTPYLRSGWTGAGDAAVQLTADGVESGYVEVDC